MAAGAGYLVYASAAGALQAPGVPMLDSKRRVEEHLATLPVPHAVIAPAYFMDNLDYPWNRAVLRVGQWPIPLAPDRTVQLIPAIDMARFAALVIGQPGDFAAHSEPGGGEPGDRAHPAVHPGLGQRRDGVMVGVSPTPGDFDFVVLRG